MILKINDQIKNATNDNTVLITKKDRIAHYITDISAQVYPHSHLLCYFHLNRADNTQSYIFEVIPVCYTQIIAAFISDIISSCIL